MSIIFPEGITFKLRYLSIYDTNPDLIPTNLTYAFTYQDRTVFDSNMDTSNVTDASYLFYECGLLCRVSEMDFSNVNTMYNSFYDCNSLNSIPYLDTSNVTSFYGCFYNCYSLVSIPQFNTSKTTNVGRMFQSCTSLRSIPLLDFENVTSISNMLGYSNITTLTDLGGFKNLKINCTGSFNLLPNLTIQSLMNVINNLYDFRANGESTTRTLQLGTTNLNKLTDEQKAVATNKGWNLT
jgi:hypothetical protein